MQPNACTLFPLSLSFIFFNLSDTAIIFLFFFPTYILAIIRLATRPSSKFYKHFIAALKLLNDSTTYLKYPKCLKEKTCNSWMGAELIPEKLKK